MNAAPLSCPQCGGAQRISDDQRLVDCRYCGTTLRVERSTNGELERLLIDSRAECAELQTANRKLELEAEIRRLDDEWEALRRKYQIKTHSGWRDPSLLIAAAFFAVGGIVTLGGVCLGVMAGKEEIVIWVIPVFGLLFLSAGCSEMGTARLFRFAKQRYDQERAKLFRELANLEPKRNGTAILDAAGLRRRMAEIDDLNFDH